MDKKKKKRKLYRTKVKVIMEVPYRRKKHKINERRRKTMMRKRNSTVTLIEMRLMKKQIWKMGLQGSQ
jgi:hypothetical protein